MYVHWLDALCADMFSLGYGVIHVSINVCYMSSIYVAICKPSLIPRLSPPPVVDCLQYVDMEGEVLGDLLMCGYVR